VKPNECQTLRFTVLVGVGIAEIYSIRALLRREVALSAKFG
jgi:hypothetical protein